MPDYYKAALEHTLNSAAKKKAAGASASGPSPASILGAYALFLASCATYATFADASDSAPYIYVGAVAVASCAAGAVGQKPEKNAPNYRKWMIAVHVGLLLTALLTLVFVAQAARTLGSKQLKRQRQLLGLMGLGSAGTLLMLQKTKPKKP
ncbi:hypothetical protein M885DRAFT_618643 [Pelagophyceae sp. CCMP2097]|nr:hypothetical protein M885DRAFT_618643 [Pelagophyceae sp. CCMP2097]